MSGKTTTIAALVSRLPEDFAALVFQTKRGEITFPGAHAAQPYYRPTVDWRYVLSLLEAALGQKIGIEKSWIIRSCKGAETLQQVYANIQGELAGGKVGGFVESMYTNLEAYFGEILPELEKTPFAEELVLQPGVNMMDLEHLSEALQSLVISSCLEDVHHSRTNTVVVIPEAWAFLPQARGNPVKWAAQHVIRQGAANGVYLWLDSQDVTGVDKAILKSVGNWFLGRQREVNEVKRVLAQLPVPSSDRPKADEVMTLGVGHFYVAADDFCKKVYVQPSWLDDNGAFSVATGVTSSPAFKIIQTEPATEIVGSDTASRIADLANAKADLVVAEARGDQLQEAVDELERDRDEWQRLAESTQRLLDRDEWKQLAETRKGSLEQALKQLQEAEAELEPLLALRIALQNLNEVRPHFELTENVLSSITVAVADRLGQTPNMSMVAPQEALRHKYQQEALDRLWEQVKEFDVQQRRALEWLIMAGKSTPRNALAGELGIPTAGGSFTRFGERLKALVDDGWLSSDTHGLKTRVQETVAATLAAYTDDPTQVEETFNHLVGLLAGGESNGQQE